MRAELIGQFKPCMTDIYLHIDARMADYMATHLRLGGDLNATPAWMLSAHLRIA